MIFLDTWRLSTDEFDLLTVYKGLDLCLIFVFTFDNTTDVRTKFVRNNFVMFLSFWKICNSWILFNALALSNEVYNFVLSQVAQKLPAIQV